MTGTRGNPRLAQSGVALSSLGAVGGARGTAAGGLRILVEFFTQYDPAAVGQLEQDLQKLEAQEAKQNAKALSLEQQASNRRIKIAQAEAVIRAKITDRASKADIAKSRKLRETGSATDTKAAQALLNLALSRQNLTAKEERMIRAQIGHKTRLRSLEASIETITKQRLVTEEQIAATQSQLGGLKGLKAGVLPKLGGLALGAIGGIFGGAVLGVGFAAAEALLEKIGEGLRDIFDPAHKAREALQEVGSAINKIKDAGEGLTSEAAVLQFLRSLGIDADEATVRLLEQAAAAQKAKEFIDSYMQTGLVASQANALYAEQVKRLTDQLYSEIKAEAIRTHTYNALNSVQQEAAFRAAAEAEAIYRLSNAERIAAEEAARLSAEQERLQRQLAATASLARFAAEALSQSITAGAQAAFINPIQSQIEGLQDSGPSAKTQALEAKIEQLQNQGQGASQKNSQLAEIAEQRALILLRQRLRMMGTEIDLTKFSGKFLLEAINAKIRALEKQKAAQDRLNRALDLQFRMTQVIRRNQGESINDFMERRAQENRHLLAEQRDLEFERIRESLAEQQEKVQDEVALAELSERAKNAAAQSGADNRIKQLQKELKASQKADADALKAKIEALQKQSAAYEQAAQDAAYYASVAANEEITEAARAAKKVGQIAALSGKQRGLIAAKEFLTALLQSGVLSPAEAGQISIAINRINNTLAAIGAAQAQLAKEQGGPANKPKAYAEGGFIPLNAGSTPFGQNARFGEHGTEGGMLVMTTKMMNKFGNRGGQMFGDLIIQRSDDPQRDYFRAKQMVKEVVREELRG